MTTYTINNTGLGKMEDHFRKVLKNPETAGNWVSYVISNFNNDRRQSVPTVASLAEQLYNNSSRYTDYVFATEDFDEVA